MDEWRHDTAVRILLGAIARIAAQHDRIIEPVLAMFDGHHVRVTVRILRSKSAASQVHAWMAAAITDQDLRPSILGTVRQSISIVHP